MFVDRPFEEFVVGQTWRSSRCRTVTEADIVLFAALTGDWHPIHTDAFYAKNSFFGQRIAHGLLILGVASGLAKLDSEFLVALSGLDRVRFFKPVYIGDTIGLYSKVEDKRELSQDRGLVSFSFSVFKLIGDLIGRQEQEEVVLEGTVTFFVRRRK